MPTYDYECTSCGHVFEVFHSMSAESVKDCPAEGCGGKGTVRRLIGGGAGLIFKGKGFYITDYKGSNAANSCPAVAKSESKSESAPPPCQTGACPLEK